MSVRSAEWLQVHHGEAPLIVTFPHTGTDIPDGLMASFNSPWNARRDTDWWINLLYAFVHEVGATTVRTTVSRSVIDVNRDPSGSSLYPGQFTTGLCPATDFDGVPLHAPNLPTASEIERRRETWFDPYHAAIATEIERLRIVHGRVVLYDAHSIRSRIPALFEGELPHFNIGTAAGTSCAHALTAAVEANCAASGLSYVVDGRFKGGWTTRHHGRPGDGVHAIQMELAQRGYMSEPRVPCPDNWPTPIDADPAVLHTLRQVIASCLLFAKGNQ